MVHDLFLLKKRLVVLCYLDNLPDDWHKHEKQYPSDNSEAAMRIVKFKFILERLTIGNRIRRNQQAFHEILFLRMSRIGLRQLHQQTVHLASIRGTPGPIFNFFI